MFETAKNILDELNGKNKVKFDIDEVIMDHINMQSDEHKQHGNIHVHKLIITGHSLGAGVASILALLLFESKDYRDKIVCYAFSPPGCVFRFVKLVDTLNVLGFEK